MLTVKNFEQSIDSTIVERGANYFTAGAVYNLEETAPGVWTALVAGSEDYEVEVKIDPDGRVATTCDCPYEWGQYCKHEVAVLYAIRAAQKSGSVASQAKQQRQTVRELVESLAREQLMAIVLAQLKKDKLLGDSILLEYGTQTPDYRRMIENVLRGEREHDGFLDYSGTRRAGKKIQSALLDKAEHLIEQGQAARAVPILQTVVEVLPGVLKQADDSTGELGACISIAFEILNDLIVDLDADQRRSLFTYCLEQAANVTYSGWDFDTSFLWLASDLLSTPQDRDALFAVIDDSMKKHQSPMAEYYQEEALRIKQVVMERVGAGSDEIHALLLAHVHLNKPRQRLIEYYIERRQFDVARNLCVEAMQKYATERKPGLVDQYQHWLLEIAKKDNDPQAAVALAKKLLFQARDFETYYGVLKQYVPAEDWPDFVQQLITTIPTEAPRWQATHLLGEIYTHEKMWPDLLLLAQKSGLNTLEQYKQPLHKHFPDEVCDMYERVVYAEMERASSRDEYRQVCEYLRRMVKLGQPDRVGELADALKAQYPRRRAMIEELDRV